MDMKTLEAFLVLADRLNFTKSAEQLYITQPAFSRQITKLEEELGCQLFERSKRKVELTPYGAAFQKYAQSIYDEYSKWNIKVRMMQSDKTGLLRIGFLKYMPHTLLPQIIREFRAAHPDIELSFKDCNMPDVADKVLDGSIDIGFTMLTHMHLSHEDIRFTEIGNVGLCVAIPDTHPLADRDSIAVAELKDDSFIIDMPKGVGSGLQHTIYLCMQNGFEPTISAYMSGVPAVLILVSCGVGVTILAETARQFAPPNVLLVPLEGVPPDKLTFLSRKDTVNPAVAQFLKISNSMK